MKLAIVNAETLALLTRTLRAADSILAIATKDTAFAALTREDIGQCLRQLENLDGIEAEGPMDAMQKNGLAQMAMKAVLNHIDRLPVEVGNDLLEYAYLSKDEARFIRDFERGSQAPRDPREPSRLTPTDPA